MAIFDEGVRSVAKLFKGFTPVILPNQPIDCLIVPVNGPFTANVFKPILSITGSGTLNSIGISCSNAVNIRLKISIDAREIVNTVVNFTGSQNRAFFGIGSLLYQYAGEGIPPLASSSIQPIPFISSATVEASIDVNYAGTLTYMYGFLNYEVNA